MTISERVAVVTGASGALGRPIADAFRAEGYQVVGLSRSKPQDWVGKYIECDLSSKASVVASQPAIEALTAVDVLVNSAGLGKGGELGNLDFDSLCAVMMTNAIGPAMVANYVAPIMRDNGSIVNILSNVMSGRVSRTAYAASKAALAAMTKCWALELAPRGIRVNAVSPGPVDSPMFRRNRPTGSTEEAKALSRIPLHRLVLPAQVAEAVLFLVSARSSTMTGQILTIDGGETITSAP